MNTVYETLKAYVDGMLGQDFETTSKYIAGGLAITISIGLVVLIVRIVKNIMRW